jgi:pyruvate/2-oxoglutarate dehydrogenase complex dihydrolipoamide acyltransferase (E2) component
MFDAVADRQGAELRRQAFLLTGDARRAEWLAQRAAAAAELQWRRFGPVGAEEFARAELVRSYVADPGPAGGAHPTGRGVSVWDALRRLPARRRAVLVLRYDEGLNDAQIAARMGSTPRAVAADVEAGLLTLRAATGGAGDPAEALPSALAEAGARWRVPTPAPSPTATVARPSIAKRSPERTPRSWQRTPSGTSCRRTSDLEAGWAHGSTSKALTGTTSKRFSSRPTDSPLRDPWQ